MNKSVKYYLNSSGEFVIEDYNNAKSFSSFLPSVAGKFGKPLWAYYVNRGQCLSTMGVNNKLHQMMEFFPANAAYRETPVQGFRTFIKISGGGKGFCYEPFQHPVHAGPNSSEQKMFITPYDLRVEETNRTLGLKFDVEFCTLPNECFGSLIRKMTVTNLGNEPASFEMIDGLPVVIPYCTEDMNYKGTGHNLQAYMRVYDHKAHPFYKLDMVPSDDPELKTVEEGFFYLDFTFKKSEKPELSKMIVDPATVFGQATDLQYPEVFFAEDFVFPKKQVYYGILPCGFAYHKVSLEPGGNYTGYSMAGHSNSRHGLCEFVHGKLNSGYVENKIRENRELIRELMSPIETVSSAPVLDLYFSQSFLDNVLRGGAPIRLGNEKHVFYLYSRLHGDLEKDYNFFELENTYYSQGNGNFRDVNQNRRNDTLFYPFVGDSNIITFFNYLKLDGFNPFRLKGSRFYVEDGKQHRLGEKLKKHVPENYIDELADFACKPFTPGILLEYTEKIGVIFGNNDHKEEYINGILALCTKEETADFVQGYWIDHWSYNLDLLKQFEAVYPEKLPELLLAKKVFTYWDEEVFVQPREKKYMLTKDGVRQVGALLKSEDKIRQINGRRYLKNAVRTRDGEGEIYYCNLMSKIICLLTNKIASLDPFGTGVEMEANNPGWCDTLTMLAGYFGSASNEMAEMIHFSKYLLSAYEAYGLDPENKVAMPSEVYEYFTCINGLLDGPYTDFEYWDLAYSAKEKFRESVFMGISGVEHEISLDECRIFFKRILKKLENAKQKAFCEEKGAYYTYFINDVTKYELVQDEKGNCKVNREGLPYVRALEFRQTPLPLFLESNARLLKVTESREEAKALYENIKKSGLYDKTLGMYKINEPVPSDFRQLGKHSLYPPGTRENESIFMHVEYKYLLGLLSKGLYEEFYKDFKTVFTPFFDPARYGRSILENSSFLIGGVYHDEREHGRGLRPRSTGTSAEAISIWQLMMIGEAPFYLNRSNELSLRFKPALPGWLFTESSRDIPVYKNGRKETLIVPENSVAYCFLGSTPVIYHNPLRMDTFGEYGATVDQIELCINGTKITVDNGEITGKLAENVRKGLASRIDVYFKRD
jgi:hypothetical protein